MNVIDRFCIVVTLLLMGMLSFYVAKEIKSHSVQYALDLTELKQHDESLALSQIALNEKFKILRKDFRDLDFQTDTLGEVVRGIVEGKNE